MRLPDRAPDIVAVAYGEAKTKGSTKSWVPRRGDGSIVTRASGAPMVVTTNDAGEKAKVWAAIVASAAADAMMDAGAVPAGPHEAVALEMIFYRPRPKGHFGSGKNAGVLKESAPLFPATKPDVDKYERCVLDALKGVLWHDDGQVCGAPAWKLFGSPARLELRLWKLTPGDLPEAVELPSVQEQMDSQVALFG